MIRSGSGVDLDQVWIWIRCGSGSGVNHCVLLVNVIRSGSGVNAVDRIDALFTELQNDYKHDTVTYNTSVH